MEKLVSFYNNVFYEQADPRVKDWLYMRSPWPVFFTLVTYMLLIKVILPAHMRHRQPYQLKTFIKWSNIIQIIGNAIVTWGTSARNKNLDLLKHGVSSSNYSTIIIFLRYYIGCTGGFDVTAAGDTPRISGFRIFLALYCNTLEPDVFGPIMTSGWTTTYHFGCMLPDYSLNPEPVRMLRFLWWTIVLKLIELSDTIFFILRKRDDQASFLHVYHHVSSLIMIWAGVKYVGGGITSFPPMLNCAVHVIMYTYYLLVSEGSAKVKSYLQKHKKWLTILQIVQFNLLLIYCSQVFLPSCPAPLGVAVLYFPSVIVVYYMFYDFYKKNYVTRKRVD